MMTSPPPDAAMPPSPQSQLQSSACMILCWLRSAVPRILAPHAKSRKEHPIDSLTSLLSDAVVLADVVSYLDPSRLSPSNVLRFPPRNALSTPHPSPHHPTTPVDSRQRAVQYETNTRRTLYAVRKILDDVRAFTNTPPPPPGALDAFLADVTKTPPTKDLRPALRLAQVVVACASYGPRHNEFRHAIWQLDTDALRTAFVSSMTSVATALSLPPPDVLFPPPAHSPAHSPLLSPRAFPHPVFSPPGRVVTPPLALHPHPYQYPLSPPVPVYQKPPLPASPRASLAPHAPHAARAVPPAVPPSGLTHSPPPASANPRVPRQPESPLHRSPRRASPRKSSSASSSARASPRSLPKQAAANPLVNTTSRSVVSPRYKRPSPRKSSPASQPLAHPAKPAGGLARVAAQSQDDGLGLRKFSMVTNESNPSQTTSPVKADATGAQRAPLDVPAVQTGEESRGVSDMVHRFEEGSNNSKRSSEEFYTPREAASPVASPVISQRAVQPAVPVPPPASATRPPKYNPSTGYPTGRVDEIVRQSVTTSVIKQFTHSSNKGNADPRNSGTRDDSVSRDPGTTSATSSVYGPESYRSVDFSDPRFVQSPLEAPSPSNHWNMAHHTEVSQGILSPQPLFSPPQMPQRLRRSSAATQMTPPPAQPQAPNLFRSGSMSSQLSGSSADVGYIPSAAEQEELSKNQRVSFAPVITTPGGRQKPLGEPLNAASPQSSDKPREHAQGFSLPPSAGPEEGEAVPTTLDEHHERELTRDEYADDGRISPTGLQVYDDRDQGGREEDLSAERAENANLRDIADSEENISDEGTHEEVEEYVMYNSDDETDDCLPPGEEEPRFVEEEVLAPSCEFDLMNESEGQTQLPEGIDQTSPAHDDREIRETASRPERSTNPQSIGNEEVGDSRRPPERSSEPNIGASARRPQPIRPMSFSTPGYAGMLRREVPPTPPSPPALESLVRSFSDAKRLPESVATHPVSTMEPSVDLFEKLISVWQNADDDQRTELSQSQIVVEGLPSHDPPASQSTQDSTLRSGDMESRSHEVPPSPSGSRGRRPQAVRLPQGLKSPQHLSSSFATREEESKSQEGDKASVASFSDAFSSDGKDHPEEAAEEWEAALKGHRDAGVPLTTTRKRSASPEKQAQSGGTRQLQPDDDLMPPSPSMVKRKTKSYSTSTARNGVVPQDHLVKVDRRRLDWLTRQLLAARDAISRKDLQMTFAETERAEQREILLLEKQDAQSVVGAMKQLLAEREDELQTARDRLSVAIEGVARDRSSAESKTSAGGEGQALHSLITEGQAKLHEHIDRSETKQIDANKATSGEVKELLVELQHLLGEAMAEMTEKRDAELNVLRSDLRTRERLVAELQHSSAELMSQNREIQSEASAIRLEKEKADHRYKMEMSHVSAQVELVNEFSKKLHDNFRETENLRQQVLHYQDKLSHIASTSGVSKRQIKELREAVTRANDECARLRREADSEKRKRMEAIRRAEELEDLRMKDDAAQAHGRYPDRMDRMDRTDSGSFRSHEPVRPAGQNRPGGSGMNTRYHARARGVPASPTTAQKAWLVIKDKIGGIVTGKDSGASRRRGPGHSGRRDYSKGGSSQSTHTQSRSRGSPRDDDYNHRSRSGSLRSRSSQGSGSSVRSGPPRSGGSAGRRVSPVEEAGQYMHTQPYQNEVGRIRATDF